MAIKVHFVILVAGLLMAASISDEAEAGRQDGPTLGSGVAYIDPVGEAESRNSSVELVLRNMAQGGVAFQLGSGQLGSGNEVEVQTGHWGAIGPVEASVEHPVVEVCFTVKAHTRGHDPMKKVLHINLVKYNFDDREMVVEGGRRSVVMTAMESWKLKSGKYLVIRVGTQSKVALSFKL